jgi:hypothetical protein
MSNKVPVFIVFVVVSCSPPLPGDPRGGGASPQGEGGGRCGSGSWQPGWLEIHHIDAGDAVSSLIVSPIGRSMLVDAGEAAWNGDGGARLVGEYVRGILGCTRLDYVVASHFHLDHVGYPGFGGLWHLAVRQGFSVGKLLHRDLYGFAGTGGETLAAWRDYLQSPEGQALHPEIARLGPEQVQLGGGVAFAFVAVDADGRLPSGDFSSAATPPDENDYSVAALLRIGRLDYLTAGDLSGETLVADRGGYSYHDGETRLASQVKDVDVYRVSHHGSAHSSNGTLLAQIDPEVAIVQVADGNSNGHPNQGTVDRLLATARLFLTEHGDPGTKLGDGVVVGHVVLRTATGIDYTVAGEEFVAGDPRRVDADGDGYFKEADPDDLAASAVPSPNGGCDAVYQACP